MVALFEKAMKHLEGGVLLDMCHRVTSRGGFESLQLSPTSCPLLCFLTVGHPQAPTIMPALPWMNCLPNSIPRTVSQLSCFSQGTVITEMEKKLI